MGDFDGELKSELRTIETQGLRRQLRQADSPQSPHLLLEGTALLNFSSNDYLGLANHPAVKDAATQALRQFGAGSGASRLICGSLAPHHTLEEGLAHFKGTEAALTFSSGYAAALGTIGALVGRGDILIIDRLVHASIVDAARLSGAKIRVFAHNDPADLERILRWAAARQTPSIAKSAGRPARRLVVTESVFSMDGDLAPLAALVELKERYDAWLMVDEAHATGLFGPRRRGLADALGLSARIEIQMGTLGKALGAAGGYICGSRPLIDLLINRARSFIFSTAPVPAAAAAASAALGLVQSELGATLCRQLWERIAQFAEALRPVFPSMAAHPSSAIMPLILGDERKAVDVAGRLRQQGLLVPAIRYPTVARGKARLRVTLTAGHTPEEVTTLVTALEKALARESERGYG